MSTVKEFYIETWLRINIHDKIPTFSSHEVLCVQYMQKNNCILEYDFWKMFQIQFVIH